MVGPISIFQGFAFFVLMTACCDVEQNGAKGDMDYLD